MKIHRDKKLTNQAFSFEAFASKLLSAGQTYQQYRLTRELHLKQNRPINKLGYVSENSISGLTGRRLF